MSPSSGLNDFYLDPDKNLRCRVRLRNGSVAYTENVNSTTSPTLLRATSNPARHPKK